MQRLSELAPGPADRQKRQPRLTCPPADKGIQLNFILARLAGIGSICQR